MSEQRSTTYERRKARGQCTRCAAPLPSGRVVCTACITTQRTRLAARRADAPWMRCTHQGCPLDATHGVVYRQGRWRCHRGYDAPRKAPVEYCHWHATVQAVSRNGRWPGIRRRDD